MKIFLLFLSDLVVFGLALMATIGLRYPNDFNYQLDIHTEPFSFILIVWIIGLYIANMYERRFLRNNPQFFGSLGKTIAIIGAIAIIFFYLSPQTNITPKTNLFIFLALFVVFAVLDRWLFNRFFENRLKRNTLILGTSSQAMELARVLKDNPHQGFRLKYVIRFDNRGLEDGNFRDLVKEVADLDQILSQEDIDIVVLSSEAYKLPHLVHLLYKYLGRGISFEDTTSFYERLTGRVLFGDIDQAWFLENVSDQAQLYKVAVRVMDVILACVAGVISLILYPIIIIGILISSPGPIFYVQNRVGHKGRIFRMYKFRTMKKEAERSTGAVWAATNDPRVIAFGRFLRSTRLDEIPQLWNILKGDMSFVGPRAERPELDHILQDKIPFYEARYLVRPGLTGWAQISYPYGSSVEDSLEKLKYDLYYIKHQSFLFDLGIILKTIRIVLTAAGK